jgi:hypothetical protein
MMQRMSESQWKSWKGLSLQTRGEQKARQTMRALPKSVRDSINAARVRLGKDPIE